MAVMNRVHDPTVPPERRRFVAGTVSMNGKARLSDHFPDTVTNVEQCYHNSVWGCFSLLVFGSLTLEKIFMAVLLACVSLFIDCMGSVR